jgi:hypothetical protein
VVELAGFGIVGIQEMVVGWLSWISSWSELGASAVERAHVTAIARGHRQTAPNTPFGPTSSKLAGSNLPLNALWATSARFVSDCFRLGSATLFECAVAWRGGRTTRVETVNRSSGTVQAPILLLVLESVYNALQKIPTCAKAFRYRADRDYLVSDLESPTRIRVERRSK